MVFNFDVRAICLSEILLFFISSHSACLHSSASVIVHMLIVYTPIPSICDCLSHSRKTLHTHTHTHTHNRFTALWILSFCPGQPGWTGTRRNIHPLTPIVVINRPYLLHSSTTIHGIIPVQFTHQTDFSTISLQVFFGLPLGLAPSTSYISSPNQCLLFATHAHTIATCFAVLLRLYHLILVSLSTLYLEFCLAVSHHTSI